MPEYGQQDIEDRDMIEFLVEGNGDYEVTYVYNNWGRNALVLLSTLEGTDDEAELNRTLLSSFSDIFEVNCVIDEFMRTYPDTPFIVYAPTLNMAAMEMNNRLRSILFKGEELVWDKFVKHSKAFDELRDVLLYADNMDNPYNLQYSASGYFKHEGILYEERFKPKETIKEPIIPDHPEDKDKSYFFSDEHMKEVMHEAAMNPAPHMKLEVNTEKGYFGMVENPYHTKKNSDATPLIDFDWTNKYLPKLTKARNKHFAVIKYKNNIPLCKREAKWVIRYYVEELHRYQFERKLYFRKSDVHIIKDSRFNDLGQSIYEAQENIHKLRNILSEADAYFEKSVQDQPIVLDNADTSKYVCDYLKSRKPVYALFETKPDGYDGCYSIPKQLTSKKLCNYHVCDNDKEFQFNVKFTHDDFIFDDIDERSLYEETQVVILFGDYYRLCNTDFHLNSIVTHSRRSIDIIYTLYF